MSERARSFGILVLAIFFALSALVLVGVGAALLLPGSKLEVVWILYPARRALLMPYHAWLGPAFLALALVMAGAGTGCFLRHRWGWALSIIIFAVNGLGDAAQLFMGRTLEGSVGVVVAGGLLWYLTRPAIRTSFKIPHSATRL